MASENHQNAPSIEVQQTVPTMKTNWPEVVGLTAEEVEKKIKEEMPRATIQVIPHDSFVTMDFKSNRVRNDSSAMNQKLSKNEKGDKGDNNGNTKKGEYRNETKDQYEEQQENESFMGNLNGEQFPPIKDKANMNGTLNSPCLDKNATSAGIDE
ncbi:subtilisin inhibitor-like protein [Tanacetum coccineum]